MDGLRVLQLWSVMRIAGLVAAQGGVIRPTPVARQWNGGDPTRTVQTPHRDRRDEDACLGPEPLRPMLASTLLFDLEERASPYEW